MNASTRLEQDLTDWLRETAMPHTPDLADDILERTARIRQRPRWSFVGRWVSLPDVPQPFLGRQRAVLTTVALIAMLALLLAAIATVVGSRRPLPAPFGLAGNGQLVVGDKGDIVVIDQATGAARPIVAHPSFDRDPRASLDGTRLAFIRETTAGEVVVIVDATGNVIVVSEPLGSINPDSLAWSPDGRQIVITKESDDPAIVVIDASTGAWQKVPVSYLKHEAFWRPSGGRELLFRTNEVPGTLAIVALDDGSIVRVPTDTQDGAFLRALGWTPDGRSVLYHFDDGPAALQTIVLNLETGARTQLEVAFGHVSHDGTRVAGFDRSERLCVVPIGGGPCAPIEGGVSMTGVDATGISWSPDDRWIAFSEAPVWVADPDGAVPPRIVADGGPGDWQRTLP